MAGQAWFKASSLIAELKARPETFSYFQALRLLSLAHASKFNSLMDLMRRDLSVRADTELGFPSSDLKSFEDGGGLSANFIHRLTVTFMGLYGSASPLPPFYATDIMSEVLNDDNTCRDLMDIISLPSYRNHAEAYFHNHLPFRIVEEKDRLCLEILYCFLGLGHKSLFKESGPPWRDLPFIGLFARHARHSEGLLAYLTGRFGLKGAELKQCALRRVAIPADQRCRLGGKVAESRQVGHGALLGGRVRDLRGKFQIILPVSDMDYLQKLMPGGALRREMEKAVNNYVIEPLRYDVLLRLALGTARGAVLGRDNNRSLGLSAFLSPPSNREFTLITSQAGRGPAPQTKAQPKTGIRPARRRQTGRSGLSIYGQK
jgi:type VI secretion system protein ImpH